MRPSSELQLPVLLRKKMAEHTPPVTMKQLKDKTGGGNILFGFEPSDPAILSDIRALLDIPQPETGQDDDLSLALKSDQKIHAKWKSNTEHDEAHSRRVGTLLQGHIDAWCNNKTEADLLSELEYSDEYLRNLRKRHSIPEMLGSMTRIIETLQLAEPDKRELMTEYYKARHLNLGKYESMDEVLEDLPNITDHNLLLGRLRLAAGMEIGDVSKITGFEAGSLSNYENTTYSWYPFAQDFAAAFNLPPQKWVEFMEAAARVHHVRTVPEIINNLEEYEHLEALIGAVVEANAVPKESASKVINAYYVAKNNASLQELEKFAEYFVPEEYQPVFLEYAGRLRDQEQERRASSKNTPAELEAIFSDLSKYATFGRMAAAVRDARGETQQDIADRAGVSRAAVATWETGQNPRKSTVDTWIQAIHITEEQAEKVRAHLPLWKASVKAAKAPGSAVDTPVVTDGSGKYVTGPTIDDLISPHKVVASAEEHMPIDSYTAKLNIRAMALQAPVMLDPLFAKKAGISDDFIAKIVTDPEAPCEQHLLASLVNALGHVSIPAFNESCAATRGAHTIGN